MRGSAGDFKRNDKRKTLVDLLHKKLRAPHPYHSVKVFLEDAKVKAQAEGDDAVLAMAGTRSTHTGATSATRTRTGATSTARERAPTRTTSSTRTREQTDTTSSTKTPIGPGAISTTSVDSGDSSTSDSEDCMSLTQVLKNLRSGSTTGTTVATRSRTMTTVATRTRTRTTVVTRPHADTGSAVINSDGSSWDSDSSSDDAEHSTEDEEGVVNVGDRFVYSDEENGDSTFTVRRIARGGIVYVEEDDETCCLTYVRKKVGLYDKRPYNR